MTYSLCLSQSNGDDGKDKVVSNGNTDITNSSGTAASTDEPTNAYEEPEDVKTEVRQLEAKISNGERDTPAIQAIQAIQARDLVY